jgi:hypothetical protein
METRPSQYTAAQRFGIAVRPTVLFALAYTLVITSHEAAHAGVAYLLGFNLTLFKMWVNPDAASASPSQTTMISAAGPLFSLGVGIISWLLYRKRLERVPSGLFWLLLSLVGFYAFFGPVAATAFGGDFNIASSVTGIPRVPQYLVSALGLVLLSATMFLMGRELLSWAPSDASRTKAVIVATVAPWLLGTILVLLIYWPLPKFLIGPTVASSIFWAFAVTGAIFGDVKVQSSHPITPLTPSDLILTLAAFALVWMLRNGLRLEH